MTNICDVFILKNKLRNLKKQIKESRTIEHQLIIHSLHTLFFSSPALPFLYVFLFPMIIVAV